MADLSAFRFTRDHEWVRQDGERLRVGITDYAQDAVGDVVFVDLPELGMRAEAGQEIAEVESTKTVSAVMSPLAGEVVAVNEAVSDHPERVNEDPLGDGWMFALLPSDPEAFGSLMDDAAYRLYVEEEAG